MRVVARELERFCQVQPGVSAVPKQISVGQLNEDGLAPRERTWSNLIRRIRIQRSLEYASVLVFSAAVAVQTPDELQNPARRRRDHRDSLPPNLVPQTRDLLTLRQDVELFHVALRT